MKRTTLAGQSEFTFSYAPRHVVCYSGGHSSALVAIEVVRRFGRAGVVLLNHDITPRSEDADVKRFKREVSDYLGVPITYANHARWEEWDQFDVAENARAFKVVNGNELCTSRLKTEPFQRWMEANAPPGSCTVYYGFDASEERRIRRRSSILGAQGYACDYPLALWSSRTIHSTREVGIEPPLTYSTFKHANCVGCLKAGWQHWYAVFVTRPDVWERAKLAEDRIGHSIHRDGSLEDREEEFAAMRAAGVQPTEHTPSGAFWSGARKAVRSLPVLDEERSAIPCECVLRRRGKPRAPVCDCATAPGEPHLLTCSRVLGGGSVRSVRASATRACDP